MDCSLQVCCIKKSLTMTITISSEMQQPNHLKVVKNDAQQDQNHPELKSLFEQVLLEKNALDEKQVRWLNNSTVEVSGSVGLALHSFVLRAEELGKKVSYEKKTVIRIAD